MSVSKKDIKDISDLIRKKLELYMNVERRESRFDPRGKFTTTPKMHKYDFLYKVLDASVLDAEGRKARQAKGENARPKSSVHSPERAKPAKRSSDRAKSSLVRSSHSPRRDRRQNRRVISPGNEKRRRVDDGSKSGSRKRDGGDRAGRSYPRPDTNMDESSIVSDSVQTNASSSVHSRVSSNGIKPKLEDSPSRVVLHREKDRLSSYASKIFSEVPVDEIQLIHRYRPSYEDNGEPKYQGFSRHVGSILKSKNFVHFYNNEALHHSVDKENSESKDRLTSSKKPSRMANRVIKSAHVTKGHDDVIRTAKSSRHTVFSSLIDTAGTGTRLVKATSKEFAASSIESLTPTYTSSFHNIETSTFPQSHDPYRPSDANRPPSPAEHFRHGRSVSIASIKSSVTVHFNENKLDEKSKSVSFPVIKQPQERRITEDESSERMKESKKTKEYTEYYEDPNTKVKVDREKSNVEITKRETVEKDEQVYKIKQIVVVSVDDKKQKENDKTSDTEVSDSHEITDKEYSESYDATESVNQKSDEEGSERTLSPISDTELTDTAEIEEKQGTVIEGVEAHQGNDVKSKEEKSVTIGDVQIMNAKRHGHLKPLRKTPSPDIAKNKRRRKKSERDKTDETNDKGLSTEMIKTIADVKKRESDKEKVFEDLDKEAQEDGNKEMNSAIGESVVSFTVVKDTEEGAGHSQKTADHMLKELVEPKDIAKNEKEPPISDSQQKIDKGEVILNVEENNDDYEDDFEEEDVNLSSREESPRKENQPFETTAQVDVSVKLGSYESTKEQQKTGEVNFVRKCKENTSMDEPGREDDKAEQTELEVASDKSHTIEKPEEKLSDVAGRKIEEDKYLTEAKPEETIVEMEQRKYAEETAEIGSEAQEEKDREEESFVGVPVHVLSSDKNEDSDESRVEISETSQTRKEIVSVKNDAAKENNLHGLHISNSSINTLIISRDPGYQGQKESKETATSFVGIKTVAEFKEDAQLESEDDRNAINKEYSGSKDMQKIISRANESLATQTVSSQATQTINSVQIQTISDMQTQTIESTSTQTTTATESQTDKQRRASVCSVDSCQVAEYAKENACQIDMVDIATSPIPETVFVLKRNTSVLSEEITPDSYVTISGKEEKLGVTVGDKRNEESKSFQGAEEDDTIAQNFSGSTEEHVQAGKEIENNVTDSVVSDKPVLGSMEKLSSLDSEAIMHNKISETQPGEVESVLNTCDGNKDSVSHIPKEDENNEFSTDVSQYANNDLLTKNNISKDDELLPDILSEEKINKEGEISTNIEEDTHKLESKRIQEKAEIENQEDPFDEKHMISDELRGDQKQVEMITKPEAVDTEIVESITDLKIPGEPENQSTGRSDQLEKMTNEMTQKDVNETPKQDKACSANKNEEHADQKMRGKQEIGVEKVADKEFQMDRDIVEKKIEEVLETETDLQDETIDPNLQTIQEAKESQLEEEDKKDEKIDTRTSEKTGTSDSHEHKLEGIPDTLNGKDENADFIKEQQQQNEEISNHNLQFQAEIELNKQEQIMESRFDEKQSTDGQKENITKDKNESRTDRFIENIASELQQKQEEEEIDDEKQDHKLGELDDREENVDTTMKKTSKSLDPDTELKDDTILPHADNGRENDDISFHIKPDGINDHRQGVTIEKQIDKEDEHIDKGTQGKDDTDDKLDYFEATHVEQETRSKEIDSCSKTDIEDETRNIKVEERTDQEETNMDFKAEVKPETVDRSNEVLDTQLENEIKKGGQRKSEIENKEDSKDTEDLSQGFENTVDETEKSGDQIQHDKEDILDKENDIQFANYEERDNESALKVHDKHASEEVTGLTITEEDIQASIEGVQIDSRVQEQPVTVDNEQQKNEFEGLKKSDEKLTDERLQDKLKTDEKQESIMSGMEAEQPDMKINSEMLSEMGTLEMGDIINDQNIKDEKVDPRMELKQELEENNHKIQNEIIEKQKPVEEETFDSEIKQQLPETIEMNNENQDTYVLPQVENAETAVTSALQEKPETTNRTIEEQMKDVDESVNALNAQGESFESKTQEIQENEATQHEVNGEEDRNLIYPQDEKTDLSLQRASSTRQMNNEVDIQAVQYAGEHNNQFATQGSEQKEFEIEIKEKQTSQEKQGKEGTIYEELNVVIDGHSDQQVENIKLWRQETQEAVETERENKNEETNKQYKKGEQTHTEFGEKLDNEETNSEVKAFENEKKIIEQHLQNDTVSNENLEVVDISNQHKRVKTEEQPDCQEVQSNRDLLEKTETLEKSCESQDDKTDLQVHAEEIDMGSILQRKAEIGKENDKGLDSTEKGNDENGNQANFTLEEKQEPQKSGNFNQEIHDETQGEQKRIHIEITEKVEAAFKENTDKDMDIENREKHMELTLQEDQDIENRIYEAQNKLVDWQTDKNSEKTELGGQETRESVKREPEYKDNEPNNQSYKNDQRFSVLEYELDKEEETCVVEGFKVEMQTDGQHLPTDTELKEAVEPSSQQSGLNVKGQTASKEVEIDLTLNEKTEILEKTRESPDVQNDIKVHEDEKLTDVALQEKPKPEECDDKQIDNIGKGNENDEKTAKTERLQETKQHDHLNQDIRHETPGEQEPIYTDITENHEVKGTEADETMKTENEEKYMESISQGKQDIEEKEDQEQDVLDDVQTDKQAEIELKEENIDPSLQEKITILVKDNEGDKTAVTKSVDETEPKFQDKTDSIERYDEVSQVTSETDKHVEENASKRKETQFIPNDHIKVTEDKQKDAEQKQVDNEMTDTQDGEMNKKNKAFETENETSDGKEFIVFIKVTTTENEENCNNFGVVQIEDGNARRDEATDTKAINKLVTEERADLKQPVESRKDKEDNETGPDYQDSVENLERYDSEQNIDLKKLNQQTANVEKELETEMAHDQNQAISEGQENLRDDSKEKAHKVSNIEEVLVEKQENKDQKEMYANNSKDPTLEGDSISSADKKPLEVKIDSGDAMGEVEKVGESAVKIGADIAETQPSNFEGISGKDILSKNADNSSNSDTASQDKEKVINAIKTESQVKEKDTCSQHLEIDAKESRQATSDEANALSDHEQRHRKLDIDLDLSSKTLDEKINAGKESSKTFESGEPGHTEIVVATDSFKTSTQPHINMSIESNIETAKKDSDTEVLGNQQRNDTEKRVEDGKNIQYYSPACEPIESIPAILPAYLELGSNESCVEMVTLGSNSIHDLLSLPEGEFQKEEQVSVKQEIKRDAKEQAGMKTNGEVKETEDGTIDSEIQSSSLEDIKDVNEFQSSFTELSDNSYSYETTFVSREETSIEKSQTETSDKSALFVSDSSHKVSSEVVKESKSEHDINTDQSSDITSEEQLAIETIEAESMKFENEILKEESKDYTVSELDIPKISLKQAEEENHQEQRPKNDQPPSEILHEEVDADVIEATGHTLEEDIVDQKKSKGKKQVILNASFDPNVSESNETTERTFTQQGHAMPGHKRGHMTAEEGITITKREFDIPISSSADNVSKGSMEQNLLEADSRKISIQSVCLSTEDTSQTSVNVQEPFESKIKESVDELIPKPAEESHAGNDISNGENVEANGDDMGISSGSDIKPSEDVSSASKSVDASQTRELRTCEVSKENDKEEQIATEKIKLLAREAVAEGSESIQIDNLSKTMSGGQTDTILKQHSDRKSETHSQEKKINKEDSSDKTGLMIEIKKFESDQSKIDHIKEKSGDESLLDQALSDKTSSLSPREDGKRTKQSSNNSESPHGNELEQDDDQKRLKDQTAESLTHSTHEMNTVDDIEVKIEVKANLRKTKDERGKESVLETSNTFSISDDEDDKGNSIDSVDKKINEEQVRLRHETNLEKTENEGLDKQMEKQSGIKSTVSEHDVPDKERCSVSLDGKSIQDQNNIEYGRTKNEKISQDIKMVINNATDDSESTETQSSSTTCTDGTYTTTSEASSSTEATSTGILDILKKSKQGSTTETEVKDIQNESSIDCMLILQEKQDAEVELHDQKKSCSSVDTSSSSDTSFSKETKEGEIDKSTQEQKSMDESQSSSNSVTGISTKSQTPEIFQVDPMKSYTSVTEKMSEPPDRKDKIQLVVIEDKENTKSEYKNEQIPLDGKNGEQVSQSMEEKIPTTTEARLVNIEKYQIDERKVKTPENESDERRKEISETHPMNFSQDDTFTSVSTLTSTPRFTDTVLVDSSKQDEIIKSDKNREEKDSDSGPEVNDLVPGIKEHNSAQMEDCSSESIVKKETGQEMEDKQILIGEQTKGKTELLLNSGISDIFGSETKDLEIGTVDIYNQDTSQGISDISEASLEANEGEANDNEALTQLPDGIVVDSEREIHAEADITLTKHNHLSVAENELLSNNKDTGPYSSEGDVVLEDRTGIQIQKHELGEAENAESDCELGIRDEIDKENNHTQLTREGQQLQTQTDSELFQKSAESGICEKLMDATCTPSETAEDLLLETQNIDIPESIDKPTDIAFANEVSEITSKKSDEKKETPAIYQSAIMCESSINKQGSSSSTALQLDRSDVKHVFDQQAPTETTSEMKPTPESSNKLKDTDSVIDQCEKKSESTGSTFIEETSSDVKDVPGKLASNETSEISLIPESSNELKDAESVLDQNATKPESTCNTFIDESTSTIKSDAKQVPDKLAPKETTSDMSPTPNSASELKDTELIVDRSATNPESTCTSNIDESISEVQVNEADVKGVSDKLAPVEAISEIDPAPESLNKSKDAKSVIGQSLSKTESTGTTHINESFSETYLDRSDVKDVLESSNVLKTSEWTIHQSSLKPESSGSTCISGSYTKIQFDGLDVKDIPDKQAQNDATSEREPTSVSSNELKDAESIIDRTKTKPEFTGIAGIDEYTSNGKKVPQEQVKTETLLVIEPTPERSDVKEIHEKQAPTETTLEIKSTPEPFQELKDGESVIDKSLAKLETIGTKDINESLSNAKEVSDELTPTVATSEIAPTPEPSDMLNDTESVKDHTASKPESARDTDIGKYISEIQSDRSDEEISKEAQLEMKHSLELSNMSKDEESDIDQSTTKTKSFNNGEPKSTIKDVPRKQAPTETKSKIEPSPDSHKDLKDTESVLDQSTSKLKSTSPTVIGESASKKHASNVNDVPDKQAPTQGISGLFQTPESSDDLKDAKSVIDQRTLKQESTSDTDICVSTTSKDTDESILDLKDVPCEQAQTETTTETEPSSKLCEELKDGESVVYQSIRRPESNGSIDIDKSTSGVQIEGSGVSDVPEKKAQTEEKSEMLPTSDPSNELKDAKLVIDNSATKPGSSGTTDIDESSSSIQLDGSDDKNVPEKPAEVETTSEMLLTPQSSDKLKDDESVIDQRTLQQESAGSTVIDESTGSKDIDESTSELKDVSDLQSQKEATKQNLNDSTVIGESKDIDETTSDCKEVPDVQAPTQVTSDMEPTPESSNMLKDGEWAVNTSATKPGSTGLKVMNESTSRIQLERSDVKDVLDKQSPTQEPSELMPTPELCHEFKDAEPVTDLIAMRPGSTGSTDVDKSTSGLIDEKAAIQEAIEMKPTLYLSKTWKEKELIVDRRKTKPGYTDISVIDESTSFKVLEGSDLKDTPNKQASIEATSEMLPKPEILKGLKDAESIVDESVLKPESTNSTVIGESTVSKNIDESSSNWKEACDEQIGPSLKLCNELKDKESAVDKSEVNPESPCSKDIDESTSNTQFGLSGVSDKMAQTETTTETEPSPIQADQFEDADFVIDKSTSKSGSTYSTVISESTGSKEIGESSSDLEEVSEKQAQTEVKSELEPLPQSCHELKDEESVLDQSETNLESACLKDTNETKSNISLEESDVKNIPDKQDQTEATTEIEPKLKSADEFKDSDPVIDERTVKPESTESTVISEYTGLKDIDESSSDLKVQSVGDQTRTNIESVSSKDIHRSTSNIPMEGSDVNKASDTQAQTEATSEMEPTPRSADQLQDADSITDQGTFKLGSTDSTVIDESSGSKNIDEILAKNVNNEQTQTEVKSEIEPTPELCNELKDEESVADQSASSLESTCLKDIDESTSYIPLEKSDVSNLPAKHAKTEAASEMEPTPKSADQLIDADSVTDQSKLKPESTDSTVIGESNGSKDNDESSAESKDVSNEQAQTVVKSEIAPTPESCNELKDEESEVDQSATNLVSVCSKDIGESTPNIPVEGSDVNDASDKLAQTEATTELEPAAKSADQLKDADSLTDQSTLKPGSTDLTVIDESSGSKDIDETSAESKNVSDEQGQTEVKSQIEPTPESCNDLKDEESVVDQSASNLESTCSKDIDESTSYIQLEGSDVNNVPAKHAKTEATSDMEPTFKSADQLIDADSVIDQSKLEPAFTDSTVIAESNRSKDICESSAESKDVSNEQAQTEVKSEIAPTPESCNELKDEESVVDQSTTNLESVCSKDIDESTSNIPVEGLDVNDASDKLAQTEATSELEPTAKSADQLKDADSLTDQSTLKPGSTDLTVIDESSGSKDIGETSAESKNVSDEQGQTEVKSQIEPTPVSCSDLKDEESVVDQSASNLESTCSKDIGESILYIQLEGSDVNNVPAKHAKTEATSEMEPTSKSADQLIDADLVIDQSKLKPESTDSTVVAESNGSKNSGESSAESKDAPDEQAQTEVKSEIVSTPESCNELKDEESVVDQSATNLESICSKDIDEPTSNISKEGSELYNVPDKQAQTEATSEMENTSKSADKLKDADTVISQRALKLESTDSTVTGKLSGFKESQTEVKSENEPTPESCNELKDEESVVDQSATNLKSTCSKDISESSSYIELKGSDITNVPNKQGETEAASEFAHTPVITNQVKDADSVINQSTLKPVSTDTTIIGKSTDSKNTDESSVDLEDVPADQAQTGVKSEIKPLPEPYNELKDEESVVDQSTKNQEYSCLKTTDESTSNIHLEGSDVNNVPDKQAETEVKSGIEPTSESCNELKDEESVVDQNATNLESTCSRDTDESTSYIPVEGSDVNNSSDKQSTTEATTEMEPTPKSANEFEDVESVIEQNATKQEYTGSTVIDETSSNVKEITPAEATSDKEPITELSTQLKDTDSGLGQSQEMKDTVYIKDIDKSTPNLKDLPDKQAQTEQASEMEQTIKPSEELKDESVITQGATEPASSVITDPNESTSKINVVGSDVKDVPINQVSTEATLGIKPTPDALKDGESVIYLTATKPESTGTTVIDESTSAIQLDGSDVKDVNEKVALTQITPENKITIVSSNQMKDGTDLEQSKEKIEQSTETQESLGSTDNDESLPKQQTEGSESKDVPVDPALVQVTSETDSTPRSSSEETSYTDTFETLSDGQTTQESRFQTSQTSGKATSQISGDIKESATTELRRSSLSDLEELPLE